MIILTILIVAFQKPEVSLISFFSVFFVKVLYFLSVARPIPKYSFFGFGFGPTTHRNYCLILVSMQYHLFVHTNFISCMNKI